MRGTVKFYSRAEASDKTLFSHHDRYITMLQSRARVRTARPRFEPSFGSTAEPSDDPQHFRLTERASGNEFHPSADQGHASIEYDVTPRAPVLSLDRHKRVRDVLCSHEHLYLRVDGGEHLKHYSVGSFIVSGPQWNCHALVDNPDESLRAMPTYRQIVGAPQSLADGIYVVKTSEELGSLSHVFGSGYMRIRTSPPAAAMEHAQRSLRQGYVGNHSSTLPVRNTTKRISGNFAKTFGFNTPNDNSPGPLTATNSMFDIDMPPGGPVGASLKCHHCAGKLIVSLDYEISWNVVSGLKILRVEFNGAAYAQATVEMVKVDITVEKDIVPEYPLGGIATIVGFVPIVIDFKGSLGFKLVATLTGLSITQRLPLLSAHVRMGIEYNRNTQEMQPFSEFIGPIINVKPPTIEFQASDFSLDIKAYIIPKVHVILYKVLLMMKENVSISYLLLFFFCFYRSRLQSC